MVARNRVFITGIAGFLGSEIAKLFLANGFEVTGCDNLITGSSNAVPESIPWTECEVQHLQNVDVDYLIHAAGIGRYGWDPEEDLWAHNVKATASAMTIAPRARLVHISSAVVSAPSSSIYAETKSVAERIALGAGAIALRLSNVYGPGQSDHSAEPNVIACMRRTAREEGYVRVDGDGMQVRDIIHVKDAARAILSATVSPLKGVWLDICSGYPVRVLDIGSEISHKMGVSRKFAQRRQGEPFSIPQDPRPARALMKIVCDPFYVSHIWRDRWSKDEEPQQSEQASNSAL